MASATPAQADATLTADISPQPLTQALAAFANQTGLQLVYVSEIVGTRQAGGATVGLSLPAALTRLLENTGLRFEFLNARTVRIFAPPAPAQAPVAGSSPARTQGSRHGERSDSLALEQIVITATRRAERLNQAPISAAVWTRETMEASGVKSMAQLGALTPGVHFEALPNTGGDLYTDVWMRGVTKRHGATVGIYLDETQIPPARVNTYLRSFPLTFDLDRVEILRGPQSTLLGDHTQAGAVRFVTNQPSLTEFSSLARTGWATTTHGGTGYEAGAAAGGPMVSDVLGFRVSGWYRADGGYVDLVDPFTGATVDAGSNRYVSKAVRGALTFAPAEAVRITPSLTYQSNRIEDTSTFDMALSNPGGGDFRNGRLMQQPFDDTYYLASLKVTANLRTADLSSQSSYFDRTATGILDFTSLPPVSYADALAWHPTIAQRTFAQQVELNSIDREARFTWLAGILYSSERTRHSEIMVENGTTGLGDALEIEQTELDAFGQIALRLSQRLTASVGLRIGHSGSDYVTEPKADVQGSASDTWTAPRFVLSCQANEHNLFYASATKGYGSGGVYPGLIPFTPQPYPPDTLWSFEIGSKNDLWDGRLHLEASLFHIRWDNGPPDYHLTGDVADAVPGAAESNGFDLAVQALLTERVKVALGVAYADARQTETVELGDTVFARKGDWLPGSPWNVTASIERDFFLGKTTTSIRAEDVFHSAEPDQLYCASCAPFPSAHVLNLRAEVKWPRFDAEFFVSNALDAHPIFWNANVGTEALTLTPRTFNVSGTWRF